MSTETIQVNADTDATTAEKPAQTAQQKPDTYKVSIGRQIVLWFTFLLFLPFFISMPIMIFMRIAHGQYTDTISLGLIFILSFIGIMFIILQILAAGRQRIEIHNDKVKLKLPTWRGPTPTGPVIKTELTYADITAIEKRGEIYALMGVLGLREVSSIITADGKRYVLGYVTENEADAPVPYNKVTQHLSEKTGKPILHKGAVDGGTQIAAMFKGSPSWDTEPLQAQDVNTIRKRARRITLALIILFLAGALAALGLALYPEIADLLATQQT
ncbi:MAG: hypothetical protein ACRBBN_13385 [Methyloligellaceae bacterium]